MRRKRDADLGLGRPIERRDFLQGMLIGSGGALMGGLSPTLARAAALEAAAQDQRGYYPPERLGLRGSHPGAFEAAHALRDGQFWDHMHGVADTDESYDLIVVGGGISGLSAAHFFREAAPKGAKSPSDRQFGSPPKSQRERRVGKGMLFRAFSLPDAG
jgi:spermidine dehydrogenase